jgi:amino acid transporter
MDSDDDDPARRGQTIPAPAEEESDPSRPMMTRLKHLLLGRPRDLQDKSLYRHISLVAFLAWIGLGADGISSSCYGPEESFKALGSHAYLAVGLAVVTALTVFLIATAYSRLIEKFPHGGGGYVVASKLLSPHVGVVSGCALLVDYVLTITVSVAAAGRALRDVIGFADSWVIPVDIALLVLLTFLNLRGVRESVVVLAPIFLLFVVSHAVLIVGGIVAHVGVAGPRVRELAESFRVDWHTSGFGFAGMVILFLRAFSLGGGTYTGIEAVSNSMAILREPRVQTARSTMRYMAISLAFVAAGLILCYLLWNIHPAESGPNKTMNALLAEAFFKSWPAGLVLSFLTIASEAALLLVAAQTGFLDGPRTLANLAVDSWAPRRFAALSERLTTRNGVMLMALASLGALLYASSATGSEAAADGRVDPVGRLVTMYSINVFVTFTLSMVSMARYWWHAERERPSRTSRIALFVGGALVCSMILVVTVVEKFTEGGWVTILVTGACIATCLLIRRHYVTVAEKLTSLYADLADLDVPATPAAPELDAREPTAVVLVSSYGGLGIHTVLNVFRSFPGHFKNLVFVSIGVIDSGVFKGEHAVVGLERRTKSMLQKYVELGRRLGVPSTLRADVGIDAVQTAEELCHQVAKEFPRSTFFAGKVIFREEGVFQRFLHNETAAALQKRLHFGGLTLVILPARVY